MRAPPLKPNYLPKAHHQLGPHWRVGCQDMDLGWGGHKHAVHNSDPLKIPGNRVKQKYLLKQFPPKLVPKLTASDV